MVLPLRFDSEKVFVVFPAQTYVTCACEFESNRYKRIIKSSRRFFKHKKGKDKCYLSVNDFLPEKEHTMKKKRKKSLESPLGSELPVTHHAVLRVYRFL